MYSYIWNSIHHEVDVPAFKSDYKVVGVLPLFFLEHCVECAMPLCYSTCAMFEDRCDGRCRRFNFGEQRICFTDSRIDGATVSFRKWGKMGACITHKLEAVDVCKIHKLENFMQKTSKPLEAFSQALHWKTHRPSRCYETVVNKIFQKYNVYKNTMSLDGFLATIYNHELEEKTVFIELGGKGAVCLWRTSLKLKCGWNELFVPLTEIPLNNAKGTSINIYFEGDDKGMLTFKYFDFVSLAKSETTEHKLPAAKVKCVAWDLDNTLWNGVIGDDGPKGVTMRQESVEMVRRLDEMGVLQTIVSKNNFDIAWNKLVEEDLDKYFLYPAINWGRKSQSLLAIAKKLNINIDTFAAVDDSSFERNEIKTALSQVRVYDVVELPSLLSLPEFDIPITSESKKRRESYQIDAKRNDIFASWSGNYDEFLKDCNLKMSVFNPSREEDVQRCVELIQRSNQYNVSGLKRDMDYINNLLTSPEYKSFGYRVEDRYGKYGIVGFASFHVVDKNWCLTDFVMSCRVAQKKVERAFLNYVIQQMPEEGVLQIVVNKTDRNMPLRDELSKMPFTVDEDNDKRIVCHFCKTSGNFVDDKIIDVSFEQCLDNIK